MYEGRTRGKRMRYTYDEEDDDDSEAQGSRRSTRNSGVATPAGPTTTLSGRQVRSRVGGVYGESLLSGQNTDTQPSPATEASDEPVRASRSGRAGVTSLQVDDDAETSSEGEWDGSDEEEADEVDEPMEELDELDDEEEASEGMESDEEVDPKRLVVTLRYGKGRSPSAQHTPAPTSAGTSAAQTLPKAQLPTVEIVIAKPSVSAQATTITPQSSATNGYPTPTSTANGANGSAQPTPQRSTNALPYVQNAGPMKQSQLPFQRVPQHATKPIVPEQP
jgi:hypothetical protein